MGNLRHEEGTHVTSHGSLVSGPS